MKRLGEDFDMVNWVLSFFGLGRVSGVRLLCTRLLALWSLVLRAVFRR